MSKFFKLAAAITLFSTSLATHAGSSQWVVGDKGAYYTTKETHVSGWTLNGAKSEDIKYKGPLINCTVPAGCTVSHSEATQVGWQLATSFKVGFSSGVKDVFNFSNEVTSTYTKLKNETSTDMGGTTIANGTRYQFVAYMPRQAGTASMNGVMVRTNQTKSQFSCVPRGGCVKIGTYYYYEWQPNTSAGSVSGNKNTVEQMVWEWRKG